MQYSDTLMIDYSLLFLGTIAGIAVALGLSLLTKYVSDKTQLRKSKIEIGGVEIQLSESVDESTNRILSRIRELQEFPQVFLSHSTLDKKIVYRLATDLRKLGIQVWLANEQVQVGDNISDKIADALSVSQWVILILSENSIQSHFTNRELVLAFDEEKKRNRPFILPAVIGYIELPELLKDKQYADFRENYVGGLVKLIERIKPSALDQEIFWKQFVEPENQEKIRLEEERRRLEAERWYEKVLYNELFLLADEDQELADSLIEYESRQFPQESRKILIRRATDRIHRQRLDSSRSEGDSLHNQPSRSERDEAQESGRWRTEESLYTELTILVQGDTEVADRLIEQQQQLFPNGNRRRWIEQARDKLLHDRGAFTP
jgi:hypothetical protein